MSDLVYERHWFTQYGLYTMDRVFFMQENVRRISDQEEQFPGFGARIRLVALEHLGASSEYKVRKALSVLAILGRNEDVETIRAIGRAFGGLVAKDAGATEYEITHRVPAT